jgi:alpha-tubulin suppressor-like RCC1 family protein
MIRTPTSFARRCAPLLSLIAIVTACGGSDGTGPGEIPDPGNVMAISAGGSHTCAVRTDGAAFCWGQNTSGELGDGTLERRLTPVPVMGGHTFRAISAGDTHTCAITTHDRVYCWGDNVHGQSGGNGPAEVGVDPTLVSDIPFAMVSAGQDHSCGVATNGTAYCWGQAYLGDSDARTRRPTPVQVTGGPWSTIDAATNYTCALTTAGSAYCWGSNAGGLLGIGNDDAEKVFPTAVAGVRSYSSISAGIQHACAVSENDRLYCWGSNNTGQLGTGNMTSSNAPVVVTGDHNFTGVSSGELFTCATTTEDVYCWGRNTLGQLGTGNLTQQSAPVPVNAIPMDNISNFRSHSCALAGEGLAYCWGSNAFGAIGNGTASPREWEPILVTLPED